MSEDKILFIGAINEGEKPSGGAEAKNQILLDRLRKNYSDNLSYVDVSNKNLRTFIKLIVGLISNNRLVLSIASPALKKISYLNFILKNKKLTIFIIGGVVHKKLKNDSLQRLLERAEIVYAETKDLKKKILQKSDKINVQYLPNFKKLPNLELQKKIISDTIKFVYLSRINKDKGIFRCFDLVEHLNKIDNKRKYTLDIYGNFDLTSEEKNLFNKTVNNSVLINYNGFISLNDIKGYLKLSEYHFFLFLTNHPGEGFPGVLIDAMIAGVPIIASDWSYNKEILKSDGVELGKVIELKDGYFSEIADSILYYTENENEYRSLQQIMKEEVRKYDINEVQIVIA